MSWLVIVCPCSDWMMLKMAVYDEMTFPQNQARPLSMHDDRCFLIDATLLKAKDISKTNICSISIIQWVIEWWKR